MGRRSNPVWPIAILALALPAFSDADTVTGYVKTTCLPNSDTVVSVPFKRKAIFSGTVSTASGNTVAAAGSPNWPSELLTQSPSYLRFTSGNRAGRWYRVTGNTQSSAIVDLAGESLSGVAAGDKFEVVPYWTLDTIFPPATQSAIHVSISVLPTTRKTEVLFFDASSDGIQLAPDRIFFLTATGWKRAARTFPEAGGTILAPGSAFVIRHPSGVAATNYVASQFIDRAVFAARLKTSTTTPQDVSTGLVRPLTVKLSELDLSGAGVFEESASANLGDRKDELLVYDNGAAVINKKPSITYFRTGGAWVRDGGGNADNEEIPAAAGMLIRKASTASGNTHIWLNTPRY